MSKGKIKWYNEKKGYGFITSEEEGEIFLHRNGIKEFGLFGFEENDPVIFDVRETQQGRQAYNVRPLKAY